MSNPAAENYRGNDIDPRQTMSARVAELGMKVQDILADEKVMTVESPEGPIEKRVLDIRNSRGSLISLAQVKTPDRHYFSVAYRMPVSGEVYSTYDLKYTWGVEDPSDQHIDLQYAKKADGNVPNRLYRQTADEFEESDYEMIDEFLGSAVKAQSAEAHG